MFQMKSLATLIALVGMAAAISVTRTTERSAGTEKNHLSEREELSPVTNFNAVNLENGLVEVKEEDIPEGVAVFVLEEKDIPQQEGESLKTADNIVFRPLFQYRDKQAALARRRASYGYRRRYFIQTRPYRSTYYYYYPYYRWG